MLQHVVRFLTKALKEKKLEHFAMYFQTKKFTCAYNIPVFFKCFREPIRVPRIENRVPRIRGNYHRDPRIDKIGSLQIHTGYLTFSLKKPWTY